MDPTTLILQVYQMVLPNLPAKYAAEITVLAAIVNSVCAGVSMFWGKPSDNSKLLPIYNLVNSLGSNVYKAKNADLTKGN